jgi:6-phosphogluconolactonase
MEKIRVFKTAEFLASALSADIMRQVSEARPENKAFNIMLSGGKTPELLYKTIHNSTPDGFNWDHVKFYWGDERCVSHDDPESNYGQAWRLWLQYLPLKKDQLNPIYHGQGIENELFLNEKMLESAGAFDIVILGLGTDGHFASVFPDRPDLFESEKLCETAYHPETLQQRITITPFLLKTKARAVIFIVTGKDKAGIIKNIFNDRQDPSIFLPASMLKNEVENLYWYLDEQAAGKYN